MQAEVEMEKENTGKVSQRRYDTETGLGDKTLSSEQKKESVLGSVNNRMCRGREGSVLHLGNCS